MPAPRLSTDEYFRTAETVLPQELIHGIVREAPAPTPGHQSVVGQFFLALAEYVRQHDAGGIWLAPIDVVLDRQQPLVVQPDIVFVARHRLHIVTDRVWGAPDLVVEVLSPSSADRQARRAARMVRPSRCARVLAGSPCSARARDDSIR